MKFEVYKSSTKGKRQYRWRLRARNGRIIAHGESYNKHIDAHIAISLVKSTDATVPVEILFK